jgi:hypothetical protein
MWKYIKRKLRELRKRKYGLSWRGHGIEYYVHGDVFEKSKLQEAHRDMDDTHTFLETEETDLKEYKE